MSPAMPVDQLIAKSDAVFAAAVRVARVVRDTGPRKRTVLLALVDGDTLAGMIKHGVLKRFGSKRGSTWGFGTLTNLPEGDRQRFQRALENG